MAEKSIKASEKSVSQNDMEENPNRDETSEENEESSGDPIAVLSPLLSENRVNISGRSEFSTKSFAKEELDSYIYQRHATTVFSHKLQFEDIELSETKEKTAITEVDLNNSNINEPIRNILVDTKTMGKLELIITTINTANDELVDCKVQANVYENNDGLEITRSMSSGELKQFRYNWRKFWKPNFSDEELMHYALLDTNNKSHTVSQGRSKMFEIASTHSNAKLNTHDQAVQSNNIKHEPTPVTVFNQSIISKNTKKSSVNRKQSEALKTGWETYIDPSDSKAVFRNQDSGDKIDKENDSLV